MNMLRVVFDTNVFSPDHFDVLDSSPMRRLCASRRVVPIYSTPFFEEMARAYMNERVRGDLLDRWFPFICDTADRFCEDLPTIWHRELVVGAGRKALIYLTPREQREMIERMHALPRDGSWPLIAETESLRRAERQRLVAQREISKHMRADVLAEKRSHRTGGGGLRPTQDARDVIIPMLGRGMIERYLTTANPGAVANRWERDKASYRYFTQFVTNIAYKEILFLEDKAQAIDLNAQPDLDIMTYLLDADCFVTNEKGFAYRAFQDLWKPRGNVVFSSDEFASLLRSM